MAASHSLSSVSNGSNTRKKILFIVNPFSGTGKKRGLPDRIQQYLDHQQFEASIQYTQYPGHATEMAAAAVAIETDLVVAVGGDGSVNEIASALVDSDTVLGILPAGSGNGLAMHLGLGRNIDKAIRVLNTGRVITIDSCRMNDRPYFNLAGIGFDALVAYRLKQSTFRGFWAYLKFTILEARAYQAAQYILVVDDKKIERESMLIAVANAPMYGYNFQIAPLAKFNDGLLELVLIRKAPKWRYLLSAWRALNGSMDKSRLVERFQVKNLTIQLPHPCPAHIDGEGFLVEGDLQFSIHPNSLKVLVP